MQESKSGLYVVLLVVIAVAGISILGNIALWGNNKLQDNAISILRVELASTRNIAGLRTQEAARATNQLNNLVSQIQAAQAAQNGQPGPAPTPGGMTPYSQTPAGKAEGGGN